jgi:hypothetical protein
MRPARIAATASSIGANVPLPRVALGAAFRTVPVRILSVRTARFRIVPFRAELVFTIGS